MLGGNGEDGDDLINGGNGNDNLKDGTSRDIFVLTRNGKGRDMIQDFTPNVIGLSGGLSFDQRTLANVNSIATTEFGNEALGVDYIKLIKWT